MFWKQDSDPSTLLRKVNCRTVNSMFSRWDSDPSISSTPSISNLIKFTNPLRSSRLPVTLSQ